MKRYLILLAGIVANICQGVAYTSSIFMLPLGQALGRPQNLWSSEWGFIFAMCLAFLPVGMLLSGKMADLGYTRLTSLVGTALYGGGLLLASQGTTPAWMAATLGVMTSVGSGFVYGTVIGAVVRWFPDHRGLASGLAVGAVGVGPIILAPLTSHLIGAYGVMHMFAILGLVCLVAMGFAALYITNPPAGYAPPGWTPSQKAQAAAGPRRSLDWKEMLARPLFWFLYVSYFCGVFAGVLVNGLAAPIAIELAGFTPKGATFAVMVFAFASAGGRVLWGLLSDRFGRIQMIGVAFVLTSVAMFVLHGHVGTPGVFLPCVGVAGLCYGGIFGTFPALNADSFGVKNAAVNLAILISSFSLVALLAPQVVGYYRSAGAADYPKAFLVAGCVAVAGLILSLMVGRMLRSAVLANMEHSATGVLKTLAETVTANHLPASGEKVAGADQESGLNPVAKDRQSE